MGSLAALLLMPAVEAAAQRQPEQVPRVMVATFASAEKDLGLQAAEAIRNRVTRDVDVRRLIVIPKADINNTLTASGYSTTEALQSNDAKALATLLRADEYVEGTVTKTPTGVKVDARLVLARDQTLQQPLPSVEAANVNQAAAAVSRSYQQAREQLANERNCYTAFRAGKHAEAVQLARSALSKYPNGTIAMVCLANAFQELKQTDSVLAVSERITAVDPRNIPALRYLAQIYQERKDTEKATQALTSLMAADPGNERLREQVIATFATGGQAAKAVPIVEEALRANPGDPKTLNMAWRLYLAAQQYEKAIATGAELIRADTAMADTAYFIRTASAATQVNPAQGAQIAAQGIQKFPSNATLYVVQSAALGKAGQNAQAAAALKRALQLNPRVESGYTQLAMLYSSMNQPDSVLAAIRQAAAAGGDKTILSQIALKEGNNAYRAGNTSKDRTVLGRAVSFLKLSDELNPSPTAKFLQGASSFVIGQSAVDEAQKSNSCSLARLAKDSFTAAQENLPAGLAEYPDAAKQYLTYLPQFTPAVDDMIRRYCK